jgi:hypothetical protein
MAATKTGARGKAASEAKKTVAKAEKPRAKAAKAVAVKPDPGAREATLPAQSEAEALAWDAARDELAALFGWAEGPRIKRPWGQRAEEVERWMNAAPRAPGEDVYQGMVFGPPRLADESPVAAQIARSLWDKLRALAAEEAAALGQSEAEQAARDAAAGKPKTTETEESVSRFESERTGLTAVAPGAAERVGRAREAIEEAVAGGLAPRHAFTLCAHSLCQVAEWGFWKTGLRVKASASALSLIRNLFYDKGAEPLWGSVIACWDSRALGFAPDELGAYWEDRFSVGGVALMSAPTPWDTNGQRRASTEAEKEEQIKIKERFEARWGSRWLEMAVAASRAGEAPFERFASTLWEAVVVHNYCGSIELWRHAVVRGLDPTARDPRGRHALHWVSEPTSEQGSEGPFTLVSSKHIKALVELAPDFDWLSPDDSGEGPFDAGQRALEYDGRKNDHEKARQEALSLVEARLQVKKAAEEGMAEHEGAQAERHAKRI